MISDKKLFWSLLIILCIPLTIAFFASDRFRYPCQNPKNWGSEMCQKPQCEVTRTCPDQIFKSKKPVENVNATCTTCNPTEGAKNGK
jgi:hypothetical protein